MEVGIEDLLNINIILKNKAFYLDDTIEGEIFFKIVKLQVQKMELNLIKKETIGTGE